ncbi:MAG: hypothetical protein ABWY16_21635 [Pedobacter sp.]|uniref:hypothetical protein n=1 Tax=Pedobacter sp. TaxID=1411316 RepID=UPI003395E0C5
MTYQRKRFPLQMYLLTLCFFRALLYTSPVFSQSVPVVYEHQAVLQGDIQTFRLFLVNAFPFIPVTVNGIKGKFMFDTGNGGDIELNSNFIKLSPGKVIGNGNVASGPKFQISMQDTIAEVKFDNGLVYHDLLQIKSENLDFLQDHITPDCAGYIGYKFFKGYLFKLDYLRNQITFYKNTAERQASQDFLKGERVLAVLPFEIRRAPNDPIVKLRAGDVDITGVFDTGQYGMVQFNPEDEKKLLQNKFLTPAGTDGAGDTISTLHKVSTAGHFKFELPALNYYPHSQPIPFKKSLLITEENMITLGYRFLSQFKTVWDYENKKIYILQSH